MKLNFIKSLVPKNNKVIFILVVIGAILAITFYVVKQQQKERMELFTDMANHEKYNQNYILI